MILLGIQLPFLLLEGYEVFLLVSINENYRTKELIEFF